ncbi:SRPBCC domain-containing protein [Plantactinospora siamensis]|uniref:SRPBCC domain-containing protein n=1 Tax=Plantactinospora siamensis TaxID=555372 RepID=A0ABV6P6E5_9ACTN
MLEFTLGMPIPAPRDRVWSAWTDAEVLTDWFWPPRFDTAAELDPRPDGRFRIAGPGGGIAVSGVYREVDRPERLVFSWQWDGDPAQTLVTVRFRTVDLGTEVSICHEGFTDDTDRQNHIDGWESCLDRLRDHVRKDAEVR